MGIFDKLFGTKNREQKTVLKEDPDKLYSQALDLFGKEQFREAADILERTTKINPNSAAVHFTLGATYSRIGSEYGNDEEALRPWMERYVEAFEKALNLANSYGGLNENQLATARDVVQAFDRITESQSPALPEDQRQKIFADYMETHDSELLLGTNMAQQFGSSANLSEMMQSLQRNTQKADEATFDKVSKKYGISVGQLQAIVQEGKEKKWPFQGVS